MTDYFIGFLLAIGGYVFHLLKMYGEAVKRNEEFLKKPFIINIFANLIAIPILLYIGDSLPEDVLVMSPVTCVIIGVCGSSMLTGLVQLKKPKLPEDN
jgi:cytochrome bd-type quinol oxidase subunit 1